MYIYMSVWYSIDTGIDIGMGNNVDSKSDIHMDILLLMY